MIWHSAKHQAHDYGSIIKSVAKKRNVLVEEGEEVVFRDVLIVEGGERIWITITIVTFVGRRSPEKEDLETLVDELSHT